MLPSNDLFDLIQSMTKSEKRHFKLFANQHTKNGTSNYIKLFDAIDQQKAYNEEKLRKKFANEVFGKKIAATKYLLYDTVLKSLRQFNSGKTTDQKLSNLMEEVEILYNKGLLRQSKKTLDKAKNIALDADRHFTLHKILSWEKKLVVYLMPSKLKVELQKIIIETNQLSNNLNNEIRYQEMLDKITFLHRTCMNPNVPCDTNCLEEIMNSHLMHTEAEALTFKSKIAFHEINSIYFKIHGNHKQAFHSLRNIVALWENNPIKTKVFSNDYQRTMIDYINSGLTAGAQIDYMDLIEDLRKTPTTGERDKMRREYALSMLEFTYYLHTGQLQKCSAMVQVIEKIEEQHNKIVDQVQMINAYFNISIYYFLIKDYDKCLDWINQVQDFDKTGLQPAILAFSKLLQVPAQFELKNFVFLEYQLRTIQRYLTKKQQFGSLESLILRHVKKCLNMPHRKDTVKLLQELKISCDEVLKNEKHQIPISGKVIESWLNSQGNAA